MADLLEDMHSAEMSGWIEYMHMDDEVRANWLTHAITKAFHVERKPSEIDDDEEVIDTTKPEFAKHFKGFINTPPIAKPPQQRFRNTEIKMG